MNYYYQEFEKWQKEFHQALHDYPLFREMIDEIYDRDIKEINDWLDKNDEFYLKKAIDKLKDLVEYIKNTSSKIDSEYEKFDQLARLWDKSEIKNLSEKELDNLNSQIEKANELIKSHDLKLIIEANKIMESILKRVT